MNRTLKTELRDPNDDPVPKAVPVKDPIAVREEVVQGPAPAVVPVDDRIAVLAADRIAVLAAVVQGPVPVAVPVDDPIAVLAADPIVVLEEVVQGPVPVAVPGAGPMTVPVVLAPRMVGARSGEAEIHVQAGQAVTQGDTLRGGIRRPRGNALPADILEVRGTPIVRQGVEVPDPQEVAHAPLRTGAQILGLLIGTQKVQASRATTLLNWLQPAPWDLSCPSVVSLKP